MFDIEEKIRIVANSGYFTHMNKPEYTRQLYSFLESPFYICLARDDNSIYWNSRNDYEHHRGPDGRWYNPYGELIREWGIGDIVEYVQTSPFVENREEILEFIFFNLDALSTSI